MSERIEAVHEAIDTAMTTANAYSGSLQSATGDLDGDMSPETLRAMAQRLLGETRRMQDANHAARAEARSRRATTSPRCSATSTRCAASRCSIR